MADHCFDGGSFNYTEETAAGEEAEEKEEEEEAEEEEEEVGETDKDAIERKKTADDAAVNHCSGPDDGPEVDCGDESLPTVDSTGECSTATPTTTTTTLDEASTSARSVAEVEQRRDSTTSLTSGGRRRRWQSIALDNYEPDYYSYNYELENDLLDLSSTSAFPGTVEEHATTSSNAFTSSFSSSSHPPFSASISSPTTTSTSSSSFMAQVTSSSNNGSANYWRKWEDDNASGVDATGAHNAEAKKQRLIDFDYAHFDDNLGDQVVDEQQFSPNRSQQLFLQTPFVDADKFLASLDQAQIDFDQTTSHNIINNSTTLNFDQKMPQLQKLPVTGLRQSPIDIQSAATSQKTRQKRSVNEADGGVAPLTIDYSAITGASGLTLENTGHGWKLNIPDEVARQCPITGGPLGTDEYRLLQIHSHWGKDSQCGSEHTLNGQAFPCEVHLVHWNATKYANPLEAMECTNDGLAVVGVFVRLSETASDPLNVIIKGLPKIAFRGNSIPVTETVELDLNQLVPSREVPKYFNYEGSLTTPPYSESVIWIVMEDPIDAQEEQISKFREMYKNDASAADVAVCKENYREVQSLNARNIAYFD